MRDGHHHFAGFGPPDLFIPKKGDRPCRTHAACRTYFILLPETPETETCKLL